MTALLAPVLDDTSNGVVARMTRHMDPSTGAPKVAKTKLADHNQRA